MTAQAEHGLKAGLIDNTFEFPFCVEVEFEVQNQEFNPGSAFYIFLYTQLLNLARLYFIYCVFIFAKTFNGSKWANRVENKLTFDDVHTCLNNMKNVLNLAACRDNEFSIVHYPKK